MFVSARRATLDCQAAFRREEPGCAKSSSQPVPDRAQTLTVVLVSTQLNWHGGEEQARLLLRGLRDGGHRCFVLARRNGAFADRMADEGLRLATFSGNGRTPRALWQIRRQLRHLRPDVLHYNDSHALYSAGLASLGLGIKARIAARRVDFPVRSPIFYRKFCDRVVCVSHAVAEVCRRSGIPSRLIRVVHDGADPVRVRSGDRQRGRRALGLADTEPLLLCVAKLTNHKGHVYLLDALPTVLRKHPQAHVVLAGDGELSAPLELQARRLGIDANVRFAGYRNDVPDLIQAADLFVFPSHLEGLGSTLIDVMLAGRAIVTTSAGGIPELTGWGQPHQEPVAWTVPPRDPGALAEAILQALDRPEKRTRLAERARRRAEQFFTAGHMVQSTLSVYRELLESSRRSHESREAHAARH